MMSGFMGQVLVGMNSFGSALLAAEGDATAGGFSLVAQNAIAAIIFSVIGLVVLAISIVLMSKLMPLPFWKEIEEDQNTALGVMVGSIVIGISIIIAAAIHG
jgi:putative membrane protein